MQSLIALVFMTLARISSINSSKDGTARLMTTRWWGRTAALSSSCQRGGVVGGIGAYCTSVNIAATAVAASAWLEWSSDTRAAMIVSASPWTCVCVRESERHKQQTQILLDWHLLHPGAFSGGSDRHHRLLLPYVCYSCRQWLIKFVSASQYE